MQTNRFLHAQRSRVNARVCLASVCLLGLLSISGCGGSSSGCLLPPCVGEFPAEPIQPVTTPTTALVQIGGSVVLSVLASGITTPTYQWMRVPRDGVMTPIPGATNASYTLTAANAGDDGTAFLAQVSGSFEGKPVQLTSARSQLAVSSAPGLVFEDNEFAVGDWVVSAKFEPVSNGPSHDEAQALFDGNPGAHRRSTIAMPSGPGQLLLFHAYQKSLFEPVAQGAAYVVEAALDCRKSSGVLALDPTLLVEQGGRRYTASWPLFCGTSATWRTTSQAWIVSKNEGFAQIDGPACAAGAVCPDFSVGGSPIRFGFTTRNVGLVGFAGGMGSVEVDNWRVTVWRR